jgi:hypothetical protein
MLAGGSAFDYIDCNRSTPVPGGSNPLRAVVVARPPTGDDLGHDGAAFGAW